VIFSRLLSSMNSSAGKSENNLESYPFVKLDNPPSFKVFKDTNIGFFLIEEVPFAIAEIPLSSMCLLPVRINYSNFRQSPIFSMTFFPISSCQKQQMIGLENFKEWQVELKFLMNLLKA